MERRPTPPHLFSPLTIKGVTLRNRIGVSPMCQYSSEDGSLNDWHLVHLGSRAVGGAGLVIVEATGVEARGRITPWDSGLWSDKHIEPLARISRFLKQQGAVPGIQLAHAGRKASHTLPSEGGSPMGPEQGGWETVAPSSISFEPQGPLRLPATAKSLHSTDHICDFSNGRVVCGNWPLRRTSERRQ